MKRVQKKADGMYHIDGKKFKNLVGSRAEVFHGTAYKTCYGKDCLKKKDLMKSKNDRIVSRKKHFTAKKEKRLQKHGYFTRKGKFGFVYRAPKGSSAKRTRRRR